MIKIKKKEFIKFLKNLNEMRSSHSRSYIENAGEEDNTPIDATSEVGSLQLSTSLPNVGDESYVPSSNKSLRDAMIKVAREVPDSQIESFYRNLLKLFDKTIDSMPEGENPFNPVNESVIKTLVEMTIRESEEEESEVEEIQDDEVSGEPFNYDTEGQGVYIDLSNVRGSDPLVKNMNHTARQRDPNHVDITVFEVEECIKSPVFHNLFDNNQQFKEDFESEVDLEVISSGLESIESLEYADPVLKGSEALENLMLSLSKAFLLAKLSVFEKIFGGKRSKEDIKMSTDVMIDKNSVREVLSYDKVIPPTLHELAIVSGYMENDLTKEEARKLLYDGFSTLFGEEGSRMMQRVGNSRKREIENGQLEIFIPKQKKLDVSQLSGEGGYGTFDEDTKTFAVDPEIRKLFNYITLVKGGDKQDIGNAAAYLYFTIARSSYFIDKKKKQEQEAARPEPVASNNQQTRAKRRTRIMPGAVFRGTLFKVDPTSNIVKELIRDIVEGYIDSIPEKQSVVEFLESINEIITDGEGNITQENSLNLGKSIIKKSLGGKSLAELSSQESAIYSNSHYQLTELLRQLKMKITTSFEKTDKPVYKPSENAFEWMFLDDAQKSSVNSMMEGIDLEIVDVIFRYTSHLVSMSEDTIKVLNRSSYEAGGNFTVEIPTITFAYLAPFILANLWQKTLTDHWERYKPGQRVAAVSADPDAEIRKIERYFSEKDERWTEMAPFLGFSSTSGAKQFYEQQVAHRYAFLDRELNTNNPTESGAFHTKIIETAYDRLAPFLANGLERYIDLLEKAKNDNSLSTDEREYYSDIFDLYVEYSKQMNEISEIVMDFNVFDVDGMDEQDWIFDDEEEMVPTDVSAKFNRLLKDTVPGRALRLLAHDITIEYPNKNESFMPEVASLVEYAAVEMMVDDSTLYLQGRSIEAGQERGRREVASQVKKYFSGKYVTPSFEKGGSKVDDLVNRIGFTYKKFMEYIQRIAKLVDKVFAKMMQSPTSSTDISFSEFGNKISAYVEKNVKKGVMRKRVDDRLASLEESLESFTNENNMERVTNIIDNYFLDGYDEGQLEALYDQFESVSETVLAEFGQEIETIRAITDAKKRKSALDKLSKKVKKEIEKRRGPIKKKALEVSKEMSKRKSSNPKRQGRLL